MKAARTINCFLVAAVCCYPSSSIVVASGSDNRDGYATAEKYTKTFFVSEIFRKYGNWDYMTYEGFEHLLENLGLGRLKFDVSHDVSIHKINGTFREFHDELKLHKHNHNSVETPSEDAADSRKTSARNVRRNSREDETTNASSDARIRCLTPQDLLAVYGLETSHGLVISQRGFLEICPALVYELDQKSCGYEAIGEIRRSEFKFVWLYATLSILVMSISGLLCIAVVPEVTKSFYKSLLEFLIATGVGTLCGDALLHLLPHVLSHRSDEESKVMPVMRGTFALLSLFLFFAIEASLKFIQNRKLLKSTVAGELGKIINVKGDVCENGSNPIESHAQKNDAVASMVIIGDILHNVTDGLSIGAAFTSSLSSGFASSIAIFCHELPHELGDYATLVRSGMSTKKALFYNVVSSVFSLIGMMFGILLGELRNASLWINALTAGSFIYIALSDLVPEMKLYLMEGNMAKHILIQLIGLTCGGLIMLCVALFEEDLEAVLN